MQVDKTRENVCECLCNICPSYEKMCKSICYDMSTTYLKNIKHYENEILKSLDAVERKLTDLEAK